MISDAKTLRLLLAILAVCWMALLPWTGISGAFDTGTLALLHIGAKEEGLAGPVILLTHLGGWIALSIATFTGALFLLKEKRARDALLLLGITYGGRLAVELQKYAIARARPNSGHLVEVHSLSFPSAHAANSMIVYLSLALLLLPRRSAIAAAILLSLLIGLSRPVLGVHWPSDVLGGWAFGLFWTLGLLRLARYRGTPPRLLH